MVRKQIACHVCDRRIRGKYAVVIFKHYHVRVHVECLQYFLTFAKGVIDVAVRR